MAAEGEDHDVNRPGPSRRAGKLFLGGVGYDTTEPALQKHFSQYGELLEVAVLRDRATGKPRGFGFVTFKDPADADRAVADDHVVDGREIDVKKSVPQESKGRARKIFVGGLSPETTEVEFQEYFSRFGTVAEVQIMVDHMSGRSRGFGFVTFEEDGAAEKVFEAGLMHEILGKRVEVKPATPKGTGPQQLPGAGPHENISPRMMHPFGFAGDRTPNGDFNMNTPMIPGYVSPAAGINPSSSFPYGMYGYTPPGRPGTMPFVTNYGLQYQPISPAPPQYVMSGYGLGTHPYSSNLTASYGQFSTENRRIPYMGGSQFSRHSHYNRNVESNSNHLATDMRSQGMDSQNSESHKRSDYGTRNATNGSDSNEKKVIGSRTKVDSASSLDQAVTEQRLRKLALE